MTQSDDSEKKLKDESIWSKWDILIERILGYGLLLSTFGSFVLIMYLIYVEGKFR